jgi:hypothetical protein
MKQQTRFETKKQDPQKVRLYIPQLKMTVYHDAATPPADVIKKYMELRKVATKGTSTVTQ